MPPKVRACPFAIPDFEGKTVRRRYCKLLDGAPCEFPILKCPFIRRLWRGFFPEVMTHSEPQVVRAEAVVIEAPIPTSPQMKYLEKLGVKVPKPKIVIKPHVESA